MSRPSIQTGAAVLAGLALFVGACSDSNSPSITSDALTQVQAADISADAAGDVDELADFSMFDPSTGGSFSSVGVRVQSAPPPACVTISPNPPTNSDGDAVPDSVRFDYSDCAFTRGNGAVTDSLNGTIDFIDPLPLQTSLGVRHVFTNFARKRVNTVFPLRSFTEVQNGTREWGGDADTLGHTITAFTTVWTHPSGRTTTHEKTWVAKFAASTPGTISLITPLPAGTFTVAGSGSWTTLGRTWSVVTSTPTPLVFDPTCTVAPRFTAGELDLVVTRNSAVTNVSIVFTACGQYTVTRS
jgi:hypothetical protein